ncbi:hypothetical protein K443DRAFT_146280 [Laccaria amethystina LaAM-08-1]|uniref:Nicotinate phosphoribosyltransferase n=1 Tax=Laccaria amethystina LaAM-08-1 TaxID=1095629 RepID=A0A0C9XDG4_9AGAR|nr:hypothetical protein K443DRAFT_146280 [Laccaria amethystina LaAM-08-1]
MSAPLDDLPTPISILDTDLYKLTMQQAVLQQFPEVQATYRFTNRDNKVLFSRKCVERFRAAVSCFALLSLTDFELQWLKESCPYFTPDYLSYLSSYRFKPEQVSIHFVPSSSDGQQGNVEILVSGLWVEVILWEVPLMACLSESYFQTVITDWSYDGQEELAYTKGHELLSACCSFSDFGTRRRRSYHTQDIVIKSLISATKDVNGGGSFKGTSNVHFAQKYGLYAIGTIAHEWFMGVAALKGYKNANSTALDIWEKVYANDTALIALTDTFSTEAFFQDFVLDPVRAQRWIGLRQDSGDPFEFGPRVKNMYQSIGIDPADKTLVYSDALTVQKAVQIKKRCEEIGLRKITFGIGTFLTNDFKTSSSCGKEKSKALNMVIKLASVDGRFCIKISDDLTKNTGDAETLAHVKAIYNLPTK